ncbi:MAG: hypothetical protein ABEJ24_02560 [Candidatus Magasanikbacteria bacterium]
MDNKTIILLVLVSGLLGGISGVVATQASDMIMPAHFNKKMSNHHQKMAEHNMPHHKERMEHKERKQHKKGSKQPDYKSPYIGQENRDIKALPPEDIEGLKRGSGTPFGGMAKPAELNGVPGPKHLLDMIEAGKLDVSKEQKNKIESVYKRMKENAIKKGEKIITKEEKIDNGFEKRSIEQEELKDKIKTSANLYGDLRFIHLKTHLEMLDILNEKQVEKYNKLRGYSSGNPCNKIPEGHDPEQWKEHNNC